MKDMALTAIVLFLFLGLQLPSDASAISVSTILATNETLAVKTDHNCVDEPACSCVQPAIMKCFCPNETYSLHFRFGRLESPFDLLQIGVCRQLTLYGHPFSSQPPEFLQIFDTDNIFHERTFASPSLPVTPLPVAPYQALASAARPIRRIEFLNVTIAYLALSDFYSLNRVEQFIVQNSTVKVLGGRPPEAPYASNIGSVQFLSSLFIEVRKDALDIHSLDAFLLTNSTVHAWRGGAVRLKTNEGARVVISNCSVRRFEATALSLLASDRQAALTVEGNRFGHLADDAFLLMDAGQAQVRFHGNRLDDVKPRALAALQSAGSSDFSDNVFPCDQPLCWGNDFRQGMSNRCWTLVSDNSTMTNATMNADVTVNVEVIKNFTDVMALSLTDEACRPSVDLQRPLTEEGAAGAEALRASIGLFVLMMIVMAFMNDPLL